MAPAVKRVARILASIVGTVAAIAVLVVIYVQLRWDAKTDRRAPALSAPRDSATVARGEYIFKYQAQCWSCHANGAPDANSAPSGGRPFDLSSTGPGFGIWYTRNITPDIETGIGAWSDGEIVQAIREGVRKDRTSLFPVMPVDWYNGLADGDALAIVSYLRSIPPVSHRIPDQKPSFFAKALFTFGVIKPKEAITKAVDAPRPGRTAAYGHYLANNLAGCMDCHTPRNLTTGEFFLDSLGAGSTIRFGEEAAAPLSSYARNITPDKETGIGKWTETQFVIAVTAGVRPDGTVLDPHMPYAYYKSFTVEDLKAIFLYLQSIPPMKRTAPPPRYSAELGSAQGIARGDLLFRARCQACHGVTGRGAQPTAVKLAEVAPSLNDSDLKEFIHTGNIDLKMPAFGKVLSADELNDLVAFIRTWGR